MRVGDGLNGYTQKYTHGVGVDASVRMNLSEFNEPVPRVGLSLIRIYADRQENDWAARVAPDLLLLAMKLGTSIRVTGNRCVLEASTQPNLETKRPDRNTRAALQNEFCQQSVVRN